MWITTGAAAPVLLLALMVPHYDLALSKLTKVKTPASQWPSGLRSYAYYLSGLCLLLVQALFVASLYSLAKEQDAFPPMDVVFTTAFIMFGLVKLVSMKFWATMITELEEASIPNTSNPKTGRVPDGQSE